MGCRITTIDQTSDDTDRVFVDNQHIVGMANVGLVFAHRRAASGAEVDWHFILHDPTCGTQLLVDEIAAIMLRTLVGCGGYDGLPSVPAPIAQSIEQCEALNTLLSPYNAR